MILFFSFFLSQSFALSGAKGFYSCSIRLIAPFLAALMNHRLRLSQIVPPVIGSPAVIKI